MNVQTVQPGPPPEECCNMSTHAKVATTLHWISAAIVMIYCFVCIWYYVMILSVLAFAALICFICTARGRSYYLLVVYMVYLCLYEILLAIALSCAIRESNGSMRGISILSVVDVFDDDYESYYYNIEDVPDAERTVAKIGIALISIMLVFNIYELVVLSFYLQHLKKRRAPIVVATAQVLQPYPQNQFPGTTAPPQVLQPYPQNQFVVQNPSFGQTQVFLQPGQSQYYPQPYMQKPALLYPTNGISTIAYPAQGLPGAYTAPRQPTIVQPVPQY